ncbi:alpha-amylase [Candidatus Kaiserbacteria bacterium RIFCSPLOWO2_02_FULL_45_11b]|uniref:Alpha-amylase n=1 Tax=Candidatus Kaiserbacteria bacterium RIFCSPLOWO2_12_FULL_45_26 TaxID=1798525 RepID=A0A1F6FHB7_9BACT|nr:MAG: alpha-amylase [Candidatus Kaiserbacteria bacterium RIFCSPHIGHO2_12_45_16]OGG70088.1 MAG: alpha-amylase [Candidatus Kaiserbacteria bacterium RIFCSPLOWO2_01_FULL_45_25]OGG83764.1 MAG: alpha-amylase [Candidatus Kaiserbacteria bacterium RIFCSPLOWO2_02_FULL_45_11b]OGG85258.1 MAG: alpha-amylase [Candidatus Kaiserbacteria bacterium RIFCSPLOWO2_12_FULL_45_26]
MLSVCPYFHVHQPYRIKQYRVFDIGNDNEYFNDSSETDLNNRRIVEKVANKSYRPTNKILQELLDNHPGFKFALSFSGTVLDQFEAYAPDVLESFQKLIASGRVEVLADTYHHSLAFFYSVPEFERQVLKHKKRIQELFGVTPRVFRNTELSYRNDLAKWCEDNGYIGIMAEGWDKYLGWRSPNFLYQPPGCNKIKVLLKNYKLSDDVAFRFGNQGWESWPLSAETYTDWIHSHHGGAETINLFMDYETFGEHQWEDTGIFNFLRTLPHLLTARADTTFRTPTETVQSYNTVGEIDVPDILTWADTDRDLTAWTGNDIQRDAIKAIYDMEPKVLQTKNKDLIENWRKLQTSDHFYYMCTKWSEDGDVHAYFSPYQSPYDAYIAFMNALSDLQLRVSHSLTEREARAKERALKKEKLAATLEEVSPATVVPITVEPTLHALLSTWVSGLKKRFRSLLDFFHKK